MKLFLRPTATPHARAMPFLFHASKKKTRVFSAKLEREENDQHLNAAMKRASLRYQETLRSDPLFTDPYIRCLLPPDFQTDDPSNVLHQHCLATKFIDDKLISTMQEIDGLRQVVLLTDGMDTRPYRLKWPTSTLMFDVSPDGLFRMSVKKLEEVGAKIPRSCLFLHVQSETSNIQQALCSKGFNGTRPSIWVFQGHPITTVDNFKDILGIFSNLAAKGCFFFGELPFWLVETEVGTKFTTSEWMDKLFTSHGLRVKTIGYDEISKNIGNEYTIGDHGNIIFVAEQLHFSDDQMEMWRIEFQRIEEDGDEEGFEEL
ncbi:hypothetical protein CASFOL_005527 [Castilleja foliolosa]|uniref:S-adenosyl-L-methionine-dependent methyltransferase n=1 Tax=Castilleja foliolosa TaxID=1961234 RepID=A0ABD3E4T2_9LAMI